MKKLTTDWLSSIKDFWEFDDDTNSYVCVYKTMNVKCGTDFKFKDVAIWYDENEDLFEITFTRGGDVICQIYGDDIDKASFNKKATLIYVDGTEIYLA